MINAVYQAFSSRFSQYTIIFTPMALLGASPWCNQDPNWVYISAAVASTSTLICLNVVLRESDWYYNRFLENKSPSPELLKEVQEKTKRYQNSCKKGYVSVNSPEYDNAQEAH